VAESIRVTLTILLILAGILGSGVIYNGARIALSERGHELASLRVLGFTRAEVATMLLGEQAVITLLGIPLGLAIGYAISALIVRAFDTEMYRVPLIMTARGMAVSAVVVVVIAILAAALVRRRLVHADLISVLKTRE
jgi:putative ABC transport system permease protein